uniref:Uncharacterized protein n=1 Tax=Arundo donax TaxID=35708 RepID=A0A0A9FXW9_ARUDO
MSSLSMRGFLDADLFKFLPEESLALANFFIGLFIDVAQICRFCCSLKFFEDNTTSSRALCSASLAI